MLRKQGETILPAGGVGSEIRYQPPRHFVPLPLCAPQTGGDNLASRRVVATRGHRKWGECSEMSSSVHGASAELIGEVSRRDGGVRKYLFNQSEPPRHVVPLPLCALQTGGDILPAGSMGSDIRYQPPRHFVPLPLCAPQTGGDNHGVRDTVSTPSSRCATPPICSANRGRQSCQPAVW